MNVIRLEAYKAIPDEPLRFGTWGSHGIESISVSRAPEWENLVITCWFINGEYQSDRILVDSGIVAVPAGATASPTSGSSKGKIVFRGTGSDGSDRYSADCYFSVANRTNVDGEASPEPTPDAWQRFVDLVAEDAQKAKSYAAQSVQASERAVEAEKISVECADSARMSAESAQNSEEMAKKHLDKGSFITFDVVNGVLQMTKQGHESPVNFYLKDGRLYTEWL